MCPNFRHRWSHVAYIIPMIRINAIIGGDGMYICQIHGNMWFPKMYKGNSIMFWSDRFWTIQNPHKKIRFEECSNLVFVVFFLFVENTQVSRKNKRVNSHEVEFLTMTVSLERSRSQYRKDATIIIVSPFYESRILSFAKVRKLLHLIQQVTPLSYNIVSLQPRAADMEAPSDAFHHLGSESMGSSFADVECKGRDARYIV